MATENILTLNVGGTVFTTRRSTLTKYECFFKWMLESGVPLETDKSGNIFIDRDPSHFMTILNYLRDGDVDIPESDIVRRRILREADYYALDGLIERCGGEPSKTWKDANLPPTIHTLTGKENHKIYRRDRSIKYGIIIGYDESVSQWGDLNNQKCVVDFVRKYHNEWSIAFSDFGFFDFPYYEIKTPKCNKIKTVEDSEKTEDVSSIEYFFSMLERQMAEVLKADNN